ncbi:hypothetical protein ABE61_16975 [Lysinibacillus sphaericus]|uniref:copper amine oxidase N-terminal domain-containing protein n=1 Tax=Lysinibacillus sphaericus TaxID=1421 RepID=UPI0018CF6824|nr:stalk domain-containing protein [Lysinibacillus sphaericus]MBG9455705.1 hypothetical protein [Lysinibacillus sphaericus]MBG9477724.1 hypothetical protein [Lysinibacillus sphaericus]MBG9593183.1 hypothetical protein [Lysinibacillus sphaericus]
MKKHILSLFLVMFAIVGFASTSHASNTIYLESGNTHSNTLTSSKESQWYQINTTQDNSDINIYLANTTAPIKFTLYDSNKNSISSYNSSLFTSLKAGTYYIEVFDSYWGDSYSSGSYEIKATYSSGNVTHDSTTFEPNDTRENAFSIQSGKKISSLISNEFDVDFYKFSTTVDNGDVNIYLANTSAPIKFSLYDSNKKLISSSNSSLFESLKAGTYYIKVYEYGWGSQYSSGTYDLIATYSTNSKEHNPSTFEPNDTRENAFPIKSNVSITSQISNSNDIDFYSITSNKEGNISISLSNTSAPARFEIYDAKKKWLGSSYSQSYSDHLAAGTYYIKVYSDSWGDQYSSGTYTLTAGYPNSATKSNEILLYLNSKTAYINGKSKTLAVAPFTKEETTLVPLRFVSEELGAKVNWNSKTNDITVQLHGTKIVLNTDSYYVTVNGSYKRLQVKPEVIKGTTFVPLRFVSEELGKTVLWNAKNKSILIK